MHHSINRSSEFWTSRFVGTRTGTGTGKALKTLQVFDPTSFAADDRPSSHSPNAASSVSPLSSISLVSIVGEDSVTPNAGSEANQDSGVVDANAARSLKSLLPQARFFSGDDIEFQTIADSADTCTPGQLVVYRIGIDCPVELMAEALARGAAGILTEQILPAPLPQCIVGDTDHALAELTSRELIDENGARPDQRLLTIGIVGESGKTSTALCLATILRDAPCRVAYETDLGHSDGIGAETSDQPMPLGPELLRRVSEAADAGAAVTILELNDSALRSGGYDQIGFDVLVITGRNRQGNDFGPTPIDCAIERVLPEGVVVVDVRDSQAMSAATLSGLTVFTYGVDTQADVSLKTVSNEDGVLTAMIRHEMNSAMVESMIGFGTFTGPLAAAAAVGVMTENPLVQVAESLSQLRSVPGRCEKHVCENWDDAVTQPQIFLDACGSPNRAAFVLEHIRELSKSGDSMLLPMNSMNETTGSRGGKLWCVLAPSTGDSAEMLMQYGRLLETLPDQCILTCDPTQKSGFLAISHGVLDGVQDCASMRLVADQERAIEWAMQCAGANDTVVVLGGIDRSSPQTQRANLKRLGEVIDRIQAKSSEQNAGGESTGKPKLKLFHPEA